MDGIQVFSSQGAQAEKLSIDIPKRKEAPLTYAVTIRALLQNWRQGTVGCKDRGEVAFSNKKPWKQKGTGRARAGSRRSPLWRKGGVTFGPQPRVRTLSISKQQKSLVFSNLLSEISSNNNLRCLDLDFGGKAAKTSQAAAAVKSMGLADKKVLLFLGYEDMAYRLAFQNLPNVTILFFDQPNAFDLSKHDNWVFLKKDLDTFKRMVLAWN